MHLICILTTVLSVVASIVFACLRMWQIAVVLFVLACVVIVIAIANKNIIPIKYNDRIVSYRKTEYSWSEVKVTLLYSQDRLSPTKYVYTLVFDDKFMLGDEALNCIQNGFYVNVSITALKVITRYYQARIEVVDMDGVSVEIDKLKIGKKARKIIFDHNKKY